MCITPKELDQTVADLRSLKALKQQTEDEIKALESLIIGFLTETEGCGDTNRDGKPIRRYVGSDFKATYAPQTRESLDKAAVKELLGDEDYSRVSKVSTYSVLRIS